MLIFYENVNIILGILILVGFSNKDLIFLNKILGLYSNLISDLIEDQKKNIFIFVLIFICNFFLVWLDLNK